MTIIFTVVLIILGLVALFCVIMLIRNQSVYATRITIRHINRDLYDKLPNYSEMLYSFKPTGLKYWLNYAKSK